MTRKIVVDPITRIEGHLKLTVEIDNGRVKEAWSGGTMARGIEALLLGKDPRDAPFVTSRICGVCYSVHQMASVRALDAAFGAEVPWGGTLLRNLAMGAQYIYDHVLHFYHLSALDYLDVDAVTRYTGKDSALKAVKAKLSALAEADDLFPLTPRYEPDEFCVRDPEIVTSAVKHYLDALSMQARARDMGAIFGGRHPHYPTLVVGGFTNYPDINQVVRFRSMLDEQARFVNEVYIPDVIALGTGPLFPLAQAGLGAGQANYLAYGALERDPVGKRLIFPAGVIVDLDPSNIQVASFDPDRITESVKHAWYESDEPRHPYEATQRFNLEKEDAYSFVKAPRYDGKVMEVGPLARALIAKNPEFLGLVAAGVRPGVVARHAARALETRLILDACCDWCEQLLAEMTKPGFKIHDGAHWEPPERAIGAGFYEAPRGALGHWIKIENKVIANYQTVVPTTWNASPRCERKLRGPFEQSLIGAPVPDPDNPLNVVRIIRSFDPCLACAVHVIDPKTNAVKRFLVE